MLLTYFFKTSENALTQKTLRTRSWTEMSCSEANAILESNEVAVPEGIL